MLAPQVLPRDFFNLLRSQKGDGFEEFIRQHLIPIEGDMDKPLLGFAPEVLAQLHDEVCVTPPHDPRWYVMQWHAAGNIH